MSERYAASISIGGQLPRDKTGALLKAITAASVSHNWGEPPLEPDSEADLQALIREGHLFLCDDQSRYGEFPELETACRELGLSYTRWSEGYCECDAEISDWRPGMEEPVIRTGSNSGHETYVSEEEVRKALKHLERNHIGRARELLQKLCPDIDGLPPFQII